MSLGPVRGTVAGTSNPPRHTRQAFWLITLTGWGSCGSMVGTPALGEGNTMPKGNGKHEKWWVVPPRNKGLPDYHTTPVPYRTKTSAKNAAKALKGAKVVRAQASPAGCAVLILAFGAGVVVVGYGVADALLG